MGKHLVNGGYRIGLQGLLLTCGLALACGSSSSPATVSGQLACDDYFDAILGVACNAATLPADELARQRTLFDTICLNNLALPGSGETPAALDACAAAVGATGCGVAALDIPECTFQGTLSDGAPCNESSQCQGGYCRVPTTVGTNDGGAPGPSCGTCVAGVAVGEPCATGDTCTYGAVCATSGTGYACTRVAYGDVGAGCDGLAAECKTGLYCDMQAMQCASPAGAGAACTETPGCSPPLSCTGGTAGAGLTCQEPAPAGAPCQTEQDCAPGLGCSTATMQCAAITWVPQGQPCGDLEVCLIGVCPLPGGPGGSGGTGQKCPTVLPDGQPCIAGDASHTCDAFSSCIGGVCQQPDSVACR